ncbi:MAG: hypothetical protein HYS06_00150 [Methylocystis sp.]|nr:hypothetical protein [Methylocystis sp.]MBI3275920.1 hypothetical protein [Methylocystis sp.]
MPSPDENSDRPKQDQGRKLEKLAVLVAALAALASAAAAGASGWQAWIAADAERRQLRAYVGVESLKIECLSCSDEKYAPSLPTAGSIYKDTITVFVRNSGSTPARSVKIRVNWTSTPWGVGLPENFEFRDPDAIKVPGLSDLTSSGVVHPNTSYENRSGITDARAFISARNKQSIMFLYGHIDYVDIFDKPQTTIFCYIYEPWAEDSRIFEPCPKHNDAT